MRFRSNVQVLFAAVVLIGSLALYGCPKRPEVMRLPRPRSARSRHSPPPRRRPPSQPRGPRRRR